MNYIQLLIPTPDALHSEICMAQLADFPFESFEQEDTSLKAYIREDRLAECREEVDAFLRTTGVECHYTTIETVNWNALWESNFTPVEVEGRCVIRAPFHDPRPDCAVEVVIMPKMSFGTGHHATTWLMTAGILDEHFRGRRGLDMGSGTGVLAIVAAKLGAEQVDAVDIDEWAYENCSENIAVNGVADRVTPLLGDVSAIEGRHYDFILANINRNILISHLPAYGAALCTGGWLSMSGILECDLEMLGEAARANGFSVTGTAVREGWARLDAVKM